ncbi:MAG: YkgJ family cysteine cluster protein [Nitrospirae bacterium]|nr:YkgJ family cysteine cluster protein [Nitrospirota bacterium]
MSKTRKANKTFYKDGIRFECRGSGRCCTSRGVYGFIYLNLEERRRLAEHLGTSTLQFTKRYCDKLHGYFHLKEPDKDCRFLIDKKCTVYEARPLQCRTWPFWPENMNAKAWESEVAPFCAGVGKGRLYTAEEIKEILDKHKE